MMTPGRMTRRLLVSVSMALLAKPVLGDPSSIRELDAYCVNIDGERVGVAASQDGATLAYTQASREGLVMVRTVHNRQSVARWHAALDAVGFETMDMPLPARPFCTIERTLDGSFHRLTWSESDTPVALADLFQGIMDLHRDAPVR